MIRIYHGKSRSKYVLQRGRDSPGLLRFTMLQHDTARNCTDQIREIKYDVLQQVYKYSLFVGHDVFAFCRWVTIMDHQKLLFSINWLQLDIDMAQNAKALVELLENIHRGNNYINIVLLFSNTLTFQVTYFTKHCTIYMSYNVTFYPNSDAEDAGKKIK